ncbi:MAG: sulfurtransferase [Pseudomonadota bacterium]
MAQTFPSLVSTAWLAENSDMPGLVVLDASRHLPAAGRDPLAEYEAGHIPGARFLDLASLTDTASPVPAAIPDAQQLAERLASLGIRLGDRIVLYDDSALKTSARAWFTLIAHGVESVAVLDGGLKKWRDEGRALEQGAAQINIVAPYTLADTKRVASKAAILHGLDQDEQILDARAADRVFGSGIDPVHGGQNGRIPGSRNVPFGDVFAPDGTYKTPEDLRSTFEAAGVELGRPVTTSCGSGITASVLLFALHLAGHDNTRLYDGSWQEWEADPDTPKEQGPAS